MTESDLALVIGPTLLFLIAPIALAQGGNRVRRTRTEGVRKVMTDTNTELPPNSWKLALIGVSLAVLWLVCSLLFLV